MSNPNRAPAIDTSYQVPVHLAKRFKRRRLKCEKLTDDEIRTTDDRRQTMDAGCQIMEKAHPVYIHICCLYAIKIKSNYFTQLHSRNGEDRQNEPLAISPYYFCNSYTPLHIYKSWKLSECFCDMCENFFFGDGGRNMIIELG